jgi:carbon monoxide dehydrogenase subunit G
MPLASGVVTITATGGADLVTAGQVKVSATATVSDKGAEALVAITALAATVASLNALIKRLMDLVLKIQKKVRA